MTTISDRNFLTVGLFSGSATRGGKFVCSVAAMRVAPRWCSCSYQEEEVFNDSDGIINGIVFLRQKSSEVKRPELMSSHGWQQYSTSPHMKRFVARTSLERGML